MAITARAGNLIIVGLAEENIVKLKANQPFHHHMQEVGMPFELMIFYAPTFHDLKNAMQEFVGPDTKVVDDSARKPS